MRSRASFPRLVVAALLAFPLACSLFSQNYECGETSEEPYNCTCYPIGTSSPRAGRTGKCERQYDCCSEWVSATWMVDDPNGRPYCTCGTLGPGQTCEDASEVGRLSGSTKLKSHPATCPP